MFLRQFLRIFVNMVIQNLLLCVLITVLLWSCQSYNPNTKIESAVTPHKPADLENVEEYIASTLPEMYPDLGKYRMKIVDKGYTLNFLIGGNEFRVRFDSLGNWKRSRVEIRYQSGLPPGIKETLQDTVFDGWKMATRRMYQTPDSIYYKLEFRKKEVEWDLHFDKQGNLLKKQKEIKKLISS